MDPRREEQQPLSGVPETAEPSTNHGEWQQPEAPLRTFCFLGIFLFSNFHGGGGQQINTQAQLCLVWLSMEQLSNFLSSAELHTFLFDVNEERTRIWQVLLLLAVDGLLVLFLFNVVLSPK